MRRLFLVMILGCTLCSSFSAARISQDEISLKGLFGRLYKAPSDSVRSILNDSICHQLNTTLHNDSSFQYAFDSLAYLGKIYSTDHQLRIYSWNYISDAGDYRFFSYFQFATKKLIQLVQKRPCYLPDEDKATTANNWYGALYYNAIPINHGNQIQYILLGWSHLSESENFKIIDVLSLKDSTIEFGAPIFNTESRYRIAMPYSSSHSLALQYDAKRSLFIFNHLHEESNKNNKIPDESFSGYQLVNNKLIYKEEVTFDHKEESPPRTKVEYGLEPNK
ncbi:hypothetical protein [Paludibacter sp.]|uniref:hypothetical protein n=1 Tax=Paludibacter sp. TaxID=1898105 RepID=UPI00135549CB|nr:hypothetical protein [Paludibacter sp.]MTK53385.1 hypothetical protein [Paludibacter sp.]